MLANVLAAALRNLSRNRLYSAINVLGLASAFTAAILIALYVWHERTYDRFLPGYDQVYRLQSRTLRGGTATLAFDNLRGPVGDSLRVAFPQIRRLAELRATPGTSLRHGATESVEPSFAWADPEVFEILPFRAAAGDPAHALDAPDSVVLTRHMARKYFGRDLPIGETLQVDRGRSLRVTAVLEDYPSNTHLWLEVFGSARALPPTEPGLTYRTFVYVRLAPGASPETMRAALPRFVDDNVRAPVTGGSDSRLFELQLIPIADIHLHSPPGAPARRPAGDLRLLNALVLIGALILAVAVINFVNLTTARVARRAIEVGVRKAAGAGGGHVFAQFVGEAVLQSLLALLLAVAAAEILLPHLSALVDRELRFDHAQAIAIGTLLLVTLAVSVLTALHPALLASRFAPVEVLKGGRPRTPGSPRLRTSLVLVQFAILTGLTIATGIVQLQTRFGLAQGLRFDQDQLLSILVPSEQCERSAFTDGVRALPGVLGTACEADILGNFGTQQYRLADGREITLQNSSIGPGFFELLMLKPVAGRFYDKDRAGDAFPGDPRSRDHSRLYPTVINETAARAMGFADPAAAIGTTFLAISDAYPGTRREVVGVVPDFARDSVRVAIAPAFYNNGSGYRLDVRLSSDRIPETVTAIDDLWRRHAPLPAPISHRFFDDYVESLYGDLSRQGLLLTVFSAVALVLSLTGLLGLAAFIAERRTREIGVRKALGAATSDVTRLLLWQFAQPVLWANLLAWPLTALLMQRWLQGFAYRISLPLWLFPAAGLCAAVIAVLTISVHSVRVARRRPVLALRYE